MSAPVAQPPVLGILDPTARELLFTSARTANTFTDEPVTDEQLRAIWQLAKWPPTGGNTQPLRVVFVRGEGGKGRLVPLMADGNKAKVEAAPAVAILAADTSFHEHIPTVLPFRPEMKDVFARNDTLREESARLNATLQIGYFILAVRAEGLAAGPMGGFDKAGVDAEFFSDGRFKSILVVNIGHPGEGAWFDRLPRLDDDTTIAWA
jgi:3-hydroxypropanoate dehydrogenase